MAMENNRYLPSFSPEKCTNCKKCEKICNNEGLRHKPEIYNFHPYLGNFSECFIGYSTNSDIRKKSASGGLISSLLIYLLNTGKIDGAIVTKLKYNGQTVETIPFIARTEEDILSASGSFYLPVNFSEVIKEIQKLDEEKFAIVALPCVISNLRKAKENFPFLDKRIKYMFGLFCSNNFNYSVLDFIKNKAKITHNENFVAINFRSEWPEYVLLMRTSKKEYKLDSKYWNFLFTLKMYLLSDRCLTCNDCLAEYADISFGDAWIRSIKKTDKIGTSICISRTKECDELLSSANINGFISLVSIDPTKVADSQKYALYFKKIQGQWLRERANIYGKNTRFNSQLLLTVPMTLLLNKLSNKYPMIMAGIPHIIYRILFFIVSIGAITGYKYVRK
jgi:coenzyme F420 hydrogenase subunit beta